MKNTNYMGVAIVIIVVAIAVFGYLTIPDSRSATQKLGDAIHELPNGPDKAARQLENRTPGEKLGDAVKDSGDNIRQNSQ